MQYITFHNVTIAIRAETAEGAYRKLCDQLAVNDGDWWSDTYSSENNPEPRRTSELFPETEK